MAIAVALATAGCGGGADEADPGVTTTPSDDADVVVETPDAPAPSAPRHIESDDGTLVLDVPAGAADARVEIFATRRPADEVDPSLDDTPDLIVHELGPSGTTFAAPVTVTVTTAAAASASALPVVVMLLEEGDGYVALDTSVTLDGDAAVATAEVEHFSKLVTLVTGNQVSIPARVDGNVGQSVNIRVSGISANDIEDHDVEEPSWIGSSPLSLGVASDRGRSATFQCIAPAPDPVADAYSVFISARPFENYDDSALPVAIIAEQLAAVSEVRWTATLSGAATCSESSVPEVTSATALLSATGDGTCGGFDGYLGQPEPTVSLQPSPTGWRLTVDGLTGSFSPDGNGGLVFEDRTGSTRVGEAQPADESVQIVSIDGNVVTMDVTRTEYPEDGAPCSEKFQVRLTLPAEWITFLGSLPGAGPSSSAIEDFALQSSAGKLIMTGRFSGSIPTRPAQLRILFSGAEESTTTLEVTPAADGSFEAEVDVGIGWCYVQAVLGGYILAEDGVDCE